MIITALVNTEIIPSVLFGIFAGALSVVLSMIRVAMTRRTSAYPIGEQLLVSVSDYL